MTVHTSALYDRARANSRRMFESYDRAWGAETLSVIADGAIAGIVEVLVVRHGPEAAYALLQRHADSAALPAIDARCERLNPFKTRS